MESRLYRSESDRMVAGVCGGLAQYFRVDTVWIRLAFVLLAFAQGLGIIAYAVLWVLVPRRSRLSAPTEEVIKEDVAYLKERVKEMEERARAAFRGEKAPAQSPPEEAQPSASAPEEVSPSRQRSLFLVGLILILVGALLVLNNFTLLWWVDLVKLWPLALIAVGVVLLLSRRSR